MGFKVFLYNPPGPRFQRGEARCGADVDGSATVTLRPPNDLGILGAIFKQAKWQVFLRDYPARQNKKEEFYADLAAFDPDLIILSTTVGTLKEDMDSLREAGAICPRAVKAAQGPVFDIYPADFFSTPEYECLDLGIMGEAEAVLPQLIKKFKNGRDFSLVEGVLIRCSEGMSRIGRPLLVKDLDLLPWPDRGLMDNQAYTLPSGRPLATIQVARGCPCFCSYCLTPIISGRKLRLRSPKGIIRELQQCVDLYGIRDFFFRADTFTLDRDFVIALCRGIIAAGLKIRWVANSRTDTLDLSQLEWMKKAGCWLVALGLESGSDLSLEKMGKGLNVEAGRRAVSLLRSQKIKSLGFFMIGFPWETEADIYQTIKYALELDCDFSEVHIACPYPGTRLYSEARTQGLLEEEYPGGNYFSHPPIGTDFVTRERLLELRSEFLKKIYHRPGYILRTLAGIRSWGELKTYISRGLRL